MDENQRTQLEQLANTLDAERIEGTSEDRKLFLEGVRLLAGEDLEGATRAFRRAQRRGALPYSAMASVSLGECLRVSGKEGAALKAWREVGEDDSAPKVARHMAWLSIATLYRARGDQDLEVAATARAAEFEVE